MGATECFRANAAYSLYGVLSGQRDTGCTQQNFVNSFFTSTGVEAFTQSMVSTGRITFSGGNTDDADGDSYPGGVSSVCQTNDANNNRLLEGNSIAHNTKYNSGVGSTGLTCSGKKFVMKTFKDPFCDLSSSQKTVSSLNTFNSQIQKAHCIPIYSSNSGNNQNYEEGALSLLYNSHSCSIRENPTACPDPFGSLKRYALASEKAVNKTLYSKQSRTIRAFSILFMVLGLLFIMCSVLVYLRRSRLSRLRAMTRKMKNKRHKSRWMSGEKSDRGQTSRRGSRSNQEEAPGRVGRRLFGRK